MRELSVRVPADAVEDVLDELLAIAPHGVIEVPRGDAVELRVRGDGEAMPSRDAIAACAPQWAGTLGERDVPDDWPARRVTDHEPLIVDGRIAVRPSWAPRTPGGLPEVVLDDDQAFGVGGHPTTLACLGALCALAPGERLADLGCGSGILAIAAALLGWREVVAVDAAPQAVAATRANAKHSGVELELHEADLAGAAAEPADCVLANVPLAAHETLAPALPRLPAALIASGVLAGDADALVALYERRNPASVQLTEHGGWALLVVHG